MLLRFYLALALPAAGSAHFCNASSCLERERQKEPRTERRPLALPARLAVRPAPQLVNVVFYLAPNAYTLSMPCSWYLLFVKVSNFVRWSCWALVRDSAQKIVLFRSPILWHGAGGAWASQ